jgi:hypothetical protein
MKILRRQYDAYVKAETRELERLASEESPTAEAKVIEHLNRAQLMKVLDSLEPYLVLLQSSVNLPPQDMSPIPAVHAIVYAASHVPRLEELSAIRQQLLRKYNPIFAVVKMELIDQSLVNLLNTHVDTLTALNWLNERAPGKIWANKIKLSQQIDFQYPESQLHTDSLPSDWNSQKIPDALQHDDDDDDDAPGGLGDSTNSGPPTDSPIAPIEVIEFPSLPLYPSLSLSDSLETPQQSRPQASLN